MSKHNQLAIEITDGQIAPRYPATTKELTVNKAVITTQGTQKGAPIVDLQVTAPDGTEFFLSMTGNIFITLGGAVEVAALRQYPVSDKPIT